MYNTVLCECGFKNEPHNLFSKMTELEISPNIVTYTLIYDFCSMSQMSLIFQKQINPNNIYTYNILADVFFKEGRTTNALTTFTMIVKYGLTMFTF